MNLKSGQQTDKIESDMYASVDDPNSHENEQQGETSL